MSRRSSRKLNSVLSYTEVDEVPKSEAAEKFEKRSPNKKVCKVFNKEQVEIASESVTSAKRTDIAENIGCAVEAVTVVKAETSTKNRRVKIEADTSDGDSQNKAKVKAKRKAEVDEVEQEVDVKKVKKRKTKEEKAAEAMPLAARTPIQTLKKAMYIGAHVSGAGGKYFHPTHQHLA
jgi:AP endonuclease-1